MNLGEEEYDIGKKQITRDIFQSKDKTQNAEQFIENWQKTKQWHKDNSAKNKQEAIPEEDEEAEFDEKEESKKPETKDDVIMNLDPTKINKKDQIFMDFFSMYGKSFIMKKRAE